MAGLADVLRSVGIAVFGPSRGAAAIEGSKTFAKDVMAAAGVPTAATLAEPVAPCVLKADGLAAGKGVVVCTTQAEVEAGLAELDGLRRPARDRGAARGAGGVGVRALRRRSASGAPGGAGFKRAFDGDHGPNTGGMGSFAPVPGFGGDAVEELVDLTCRPVLAELAARGIPVRRDPLRRADADPGRASGARVQLPLRRPRDAVGAAARRRRPAGRARGCGRRGSRLASRSKRAAGAAVTVVLDGGRLPGARRPGLADRRDRGGRGDGRARLPCRAPPCATAPSSRTAAAILNVTGTRRRPRGRARCRLRGCGPDLVGRRAVRRDDIAACGERCVAPAGGTPRHALE